MADGRPDEYETPKPVVRCLYDKLVSTKKLKPHPKNRNSHPKDQIERLAEILKYQGFRYPIKVSNQSGFITSGHGRVEASNLNGWKEVPVNYQDYDNEDQEYADVQADNAIAFWSELDPKYCDVIVSRWEKYTGKKSELING